MNKLICKFRRHTTGSWEPAQFGTGIVIWTIYCKRCKYRIEYHSPRARLIGTELKFGFDGK